MSTNNTLGAMVKLYERIGFNEPAVISDIMHDYLTQNETRSGRSVLWYSDIVQNIAIYEDTLEFLTEDEIVSELC